MEGIPVHRHVSAVRETPWVNIMSEVVELSLALAGRGSRFPVKQLRFDQKRLKVTVVATFEIASTEVRDEIERNVTEALSTLALRGNLETAYEVIR
jgi:hypothetical protein